MSVRESVCVTCVCLCCERKRAGCVTANYREEKGFSERQSEREMERERETEQERETEREREKKNGR